MAGEIYEVLERPTFRNNWPLRDQLNRASLSIVANIAEGFAQQSDRAFARYLFLARGSASEVRALLDIARDQEKLELQEFEYLQRQCSGISRMLSALIRHLINENRVLPRPRSGSPLDLG